MNPDEFVTNGFVLAMQILESLGVNIDGRAVMRQLEEVATGELSLYNNPQEELADAERNRDREAPPEERQWHQGIMANRVMLDALNRQTANQVLGVFQRDPPPF